MPKGLWFPAKYFYSFVSFLCFCMKLCSNRTCDCSLHPAVVAASIRSSKCKIHTSWYLLHKDLDETLLTDRAKVLNNIPVLQPFVESYLFMERLRVPERQGVTQRKSFPLSVFWKNNVSQSTIERETVSHTCCPSLGSPWWQCVLGCSGPSQRKPHHMSLYPEPLCRHSQWSHIWTAEMRSRRWLCIDVWALWGTSQTQTDTKTSGGKTDIMLSKYFCL